MAKIPRISQLAFGFATDHAPDLLALSKAAKVDDDARDELIGRRVAEKGRDRIVDALADVRPIELVAEQEDDRGVESDPFYPDDDDLDTIRKSGGCVGVRALWLPSAHVLTVGGRVLRSDWLADPRSASKALKDCCSSWEAVRIAGRLTSAPHRCNSAICPICRRLDAAERAEEWSALIAALVRRDVRVVGVTLTQPILGSDGWSDAPVLLIGDEATVYVGRGGDDANGYVSVASEPIGHALNRLRYAWELLKKGQASRFEWESSVFGGVYGIEATGRIGIGPLDEHGVAGPPYLPRWHVHMHALVLLRPGVDLGVCRCSSCTVAAGEDGKTAGVYADDVPGWWPWLVRNWVDRCTVWGDESAHGKGQHMAELRGNADDVMRAVKETLKYPCKLGELTRAQVLDWLAVTKGRKWHMPFGALHSASRIRKVAKRDLVLRDDNSVRD